MDKNQLSDAARYDAIKAKYMQAANSRLVKISIARANVECCKTVVKELEEQRNGLPGVVSHEVTKERMRLSHAIREAKKRLTDKEHELWSVDGTQEAVEEIVNNII